MKHVRLSSFAVFATIITFVLLFASCGRASDESPAGASGAAPNVSATDVAVGSEGKLHAEGGTVSGAVDEPTFGDMYNAVFMKDTATIDRLKQAGRVIAVPNGTRVQVLYAGTPVKRQVQILEGEHQGKKVWVLAEWVGQ
ncbi:MAG: hypothetical protein ACR2L2_18865 [Acidobacteriota bacterium]